MAEDKYIKFGDEDSYSRREPRLGRGHRSISRTIPLRGDGDDEANWYKCWKCGMACNDVTDAVDDGASKVHISHQDVISIALGTITDSTSIIMAGELHVVKVAETNSDGIAKEVVHVFEITNTKGCPNDGNLNWRADR
jgi:hypothetical protein